MVRKTARQKAVYQRAQQGMEPATKADLLALETGLGERFTAIMNAITAVGERQTAHEQRHNQEEQTVNVDKEIKNDAKKAGIAGFFVAAATAVAVVVKTVFF